MIDKINKYDGYIEDRTWIQINQSRRPVDAIFGTVTQGQHNKPQKADGKRASIIYVQSSIGEEYYEWLTIYPDSTGLPHPEIKDFFSKNSYCIANTDPLFYFINSSEKSNYLTASLYDEHHRTPLEVSESTASNTFREHTISHDIQNICRQSNYDHLVATVIRPIVIRNREPKIETISSLEDRVERFLRSKLLDKRCEGNATTDDYYVQLYEVIARDSNQQRPDAPAIAEATDWSTDGHNFKVEYISSDKSLKKLRLAQTDVRHSRIRWLLPSIDHKKRAFAVSESNLRQFISDVVEKDGHR